MAPAMQNDIVSIQVTPCSSITYLKGATERKKYGGF